jgi:hypothetical protein
MMVSGSKVNASVVSSGVVVVNVLSTAVVSLQARKKVLIHILHRGL